MSNSEDESYSDTDSSEDLDDVQLCQIGNLSMQQSNVRSGNPPSAPPQLNASRPALGLGGMGKMGLGFKLALPPRQDLDATPPEPARGRSDQLRLPLASARGERADLQAVQQRQPQPSSSNHSSCHHSSSGGSSDEDSDLDDVPLTMPQHLISRAAPNPPRFILPFSLPLPQRTYHHSSSGGARQGHTPDNNEDNVASDQSQREQRAAAARATPESRLPLPTHRGPAPSRLPLLQLSRPAAASAHTPSPASNVNFTSSASAHQEPHTQQHSSHRNNSLARSTRTSADSDIIDSTGVPPPVCSPSDPCVLQVELISPAFSLRLPPPKADASQLGRSSIDVKPTADSDLSSAGTAPAVSSDRLLPSMQSIPTAQQPEQFAAGGDTGDMQAARQAAAKALAERCSSSLGVSTSELSMYELRPLQPGHIPADCRHVGVMVHRSGFSMAALEQLLSQLQSSEKLSEQLASEQRQNQEVQAKAVAHREHAEKQEAASKELQERCRILEEENGSLRQQVARGDEQYHAMYSVISTLRREFSLLKQELSAPAAADSTPADVSERIGTV